MKIGSLFTGYGGLEMGVQATLSGDVAWHCENNPAASKVLTHRYPQVPNLGDITAVDWSQAEPVDVVCAGFPCQPVSHAGKHKGTADERWLFDEILRAVSGLASRPGLLVLENVPGLLTANGGDAMARVVQGLAACGYVGSWWPVRASDVGVCHRRERIFFAAHTEDQRHEWHVSARDGWAGPANGSLLPTPRATDGTKGGPGQRGSSGDLMLPSAVMLLPTPAGNGHGRSLAIEAQRLLPTPSVSDGSGGHLTRSGDRAGELLLPGVAKAMGRLLPTPTSKDSDASGGNPNTTGTHGTTLTDATVREPQAWGVYEAAISRWESLTRPAPAPTMPSRKGTPQLSPRFSEWMMGLPDGWVTDVPGLSRNDMLRILGNGVVPQQAAFALRCLLGVADEVAA